MGSRLIGTEATTKGDEPIQATSGDLHVRDSTLETTLTNIETSLAALDNAVDGNYVNVNVNAAGTDLAMNAGAASAQTTRTVEASDSPLIAAAAGARLQGRNTNILDLTAVWAAEAAANTLVSVAVDYTGVILQPNGLYALVVYNPSTITALTLVLRSLVTAGGGPRNGRWGSVLTIPASDGTDDTWCFLVQGILVGTSARLDFTNDTVLGVAQGFTATAQLYTI